MKLYYKILTSASYDLDIEDLVDIIIENNEELDEDIINDAMDNIDYYLDQAGFKDSDCLSEYQINEIIKAIGQELEKRIRDESKELERIS